MSEPKREPGEYRVKYLGRWTVAQWECDEWYRFGWDDFYEDADFDAIGPRLPDYNPEEPPQAAGGE